MYSISKSHINIRMLLRVIGWLLLIESAFMLIPVVTSIIYGCEDLISFIISITITSCVGMLLMSLRPKSREMGRREAIMLTASIWVVFTIFGMLPFILQGTHTSLTDAFFETMSGFTTTGVTVLTASTNIPEGILMWRCVIQWIGGMGIILFTLAVLPMLNYQGGMQLFNAEVTGITHDKLRPRVSSSAKGLWMVYIILTILLIVLLSFSDMSLFDSICHGLSTMSTGGFSTNEMETEAWNTDYVRAVVCVFMFLGGVNFALLYKASTGQFSGIWKNDALKWYVGMILFSYIILTISIISNNVVDNIRDFTIDPLFQAISILSSTGLTESDFLSWGKLSMCLLIFMMFVGACAGSTAGGVKVDRIIVLLRFIKNEFYKMMHPNVVTTVRINGNGTPNTVLHKSLAFLFLYLLVICIGATMLIFIGMPIKDSFFCTLSAISNTGLGTDITGVSNSYELLPNAAKWVLSFVMLVGRLELYTVLLLFTHTFWKK